MENKDIEKEAGQVFDDETKDTGAVLMKPGSEGLYVLLATLIDTLTEERVIEGLSLSNWPKDRNFTKSEFLSLALFLAEEAKKTGPGDDNTDPGADDSKQPVPTEVHEEEVSKADAGNGEAEPGAKVSVQQVSSESMKQALEGVLHCMSDKNAQEELREAISDILETKMKEGSFEIESFRNLVEKKWTDFWTELPELARVNEQVMKQQWLKKEVIDILIAFFAPETNAHVFTPKIRPDELDAEDERQRAMASLKNVDASHVAEVEAIRKKRFESDCKSLPKFVLDTNFEAIEKNWLKKHYYHIVEEVGQRNAQGSPAFVPAVDPSSPGPLSPMRRKKARLSPPEAVSVLISDVHSTAKVGDVCHISGAVLYCADEVRCCDTKNPTTSITESTAVLNLSIGDESGVVQVTFWRDAAVKAYASLDKVLDAQGTASCVKVDVSFLVVRNPRNAALPMHSVRVLHSTERTTLKIDGSVALTLVPDSRLAITDFRRLKSSLPYTVHLKGVVVGQADQRVTQKGVEQIGFSLMDRQRRSVQCLAHDVSVDPEIFTEGTEVMIFYAVAMAGRNSEGSIWLYSDSYIMRVGRALLPGTPIEEIRIGA